MKETSSPDIDFHSLYEGPGELQRGELHVPVINFRLERAMHNHAAPWQLELNVGAAREEELRQVLRGWSLPLRFVGTANGLHSLYIPSIPFYSTQGSVLRAQIGPLKKPRNGAIESRSADIEVAMAISVIGQAPLRDTGSVTAPTTRQPMPSSERLRRARVGGPPQSAPRVGGAGAHGCRSYR